MSQARHTLWREHALDVRALALCAMFTDGAPPRTGDARSVKLHSPESYGASRCSVCDHPDCKGNAIVLQPDGSGFALSVSAMASSTT